MAIKNQTTKLTIVINGQEVKKTLTDVGAEVGKLRRQLKGLEHDSPEFKAKLKEYNKAKTIFEGMSQEISGTKKNMDSLLSSLGGFGPIAGAAFSVYSAAEFGRAIMQNINHMRELKMEVQQLTKLNGKMLDSVTAKVDAMSKVWNVNFSELLQTANTMNKQLGIDIPTSLNLIEQGFEDGTNSSGKMLEQIREYAPFMKEAKIEARQMMAIIKTGTEEGVFNDKAIDAIKEGLLRVREGTKSTVASMKALGIDTNKVYKDLESGAISYFDVLKIVSEKLDSVGSHSQITGKAIANIFGSPGEDAGYQYLSNLHKIDEQTNTLGVSANELIGIKKRDLEATEKLSKSWIALTGAGSALDKLWIGLKSGMAGVLQMMTGTQEASKDLIFSYVDQARKVKDLETRLIPLASEHDTLIKKTNRNQTEQTRLKEIIEQLGAAVPSAVTEFDKYGNAVAINTKKVKEFIEKQKQMLQYRNKAAIQSTEEDINTSKKEKEKLEAELKKGTKSVTYQSGGGMFGNLVSSATSKLSDSEIYKKQTRIKELQNTIDGANESLKYLLGKNWEALEEKENQVENPVTKGTNTNSDNKTKQKKDTTASDRKKLQEEVLKEEEKFQKSLMDAERKYQDETFSLLSDGIEKEQTLLAISYARKQEDLEKEIADLLVLQKEYSEKASKASQLGDTVTAEKFKKLAAEQVQIIRTKEDTIDALEKTHSLKRLELVYKYRQKEIEKQKQSYARELQNLEIKHNTELSSLVDFQTAKNILQNYLVEEELKQIKTFSEAKKVLIRSQEKEILTLQLEQIEKLREGINNELQENADKGFNGLDGLFTPEQLEEKKKQLDELILKSSELKKILSGKVQDETNEESEKKQSERSQLLSGIDILGFSAVEWEKAFTNLDTWAEKIKAAGMVVQSLQNAWAMMYEAQQAAVQKSIQLTENESRKKQQTLKKQLDEGYLTQEQYEAKKEKLEADTERRKAQIEYQTAMQKYRMDIANALSNTALGVTSALATSGNIWTGLALATAVGAMGALQLGVIKANKPVRSYAQGGVTSGLGFKDDTGEEVAGVAHADEYYIPRWLRKDPEIAPLERYIEYKRKGGTRSFAEGGETSPKTSNTDVYPIESSVNLLLLNVLKENGELLSYLKENGLIAFLSNDVKTLLNLSKQQEQAKKIMTNNKIFK